MLMAIVGDILGSSIEFEHDKPSLAELSIPALADVGRVTDDTVMTLATWKWWTDFRSGRAKVEEYVEYLRSYFHLTPGIGYGPKFFRFMRDGIIPDPPSCGN
ncbi:MAG TPA: hypothetical protein PLY73_05925, partial [Candidatus Ozemobacteraceae bacterium]|nr:hypothetical protein [Candidatus Ozemobacteraceae bacterium]